MSLHWSFPGKDLEGGFLCHRSILSLTVSKIISSQPFFSSCTPVEEFLRDFFLLGADKEIQLTRTPVRVT